MMHHPGNPGCINPWPSGKVVMTDRRPDRFSAELFVRNERDGPCSGFRLRCRRLSIGHQPLDSQRGWAGVIGRVLPVEFGLIVGPARIHQSAVLECGG